MGRSKSSHQWLKKHFDDEFVKRAQREGYRSRAVYKLDEIQQKDRILRPGSVLVDLGAAPGGSRRGTMPAFQMGGPRLIRASRRSSRLA